MKTDYLRMGMGAEQNDVRKLVVFVVGEVCYGVDIMAVKEVVNPEPLIPVPRLPSYALGVADHRDTVMPVVDLRSRFGLPPRAADKRTKWLVIRLRGGVVGLQVDRVTQVLRVDQSMVKPTFEMAVAQKPWIDITYRAADTLVFLLSLESVVDADRLQLDPRAEGGPGS